MGAVVPGTMVRLLALASLRSASASLESSVQLAHEATVNPHGFGCSSSQRSIRSTALRGNGRASHAESPPFRAVSWVSDFGEMRAIGEKPVGGIDHRFTRLCQTAEGKLPGQNFRRRGKNFILKISYQFWTQQLPLPRRRPGRTPTPKQPRREFKIR